MSFRFTFEALSTEYRAILAEGYEVYTCHRYATTAPSSRGKKLLINRVDVDFSLDKARALAELFNGLGIHATFFVRLHAKEYNPFSFEGYRVLKYIRESGHEIGYHSEIVDQAEIWKEDPAECLKRDLRVLESIVGAPILGAASHGGMTGFNNLDFWKAHAPKEFGLLYEAYDQEASFNLFQNSLYVSDSNWTYWKCYLNGVIREGDRRSPAEHARDGHAPIYLLIHPDTYFREHFYE
jgi:hypothetical protein